MIKLTRKQKKLLNEIKEITESIGIGFQDLESIKKDYGSEFLTPHLERIKDHLVRSGIIMDYALIDEHLNSLTTKYFFSKKSKFIKLWKTKKFKNFSYYILEKLYLINKLELAQSICKIPNNIISNIYKINDLRNGLAHTFFPDNLRRNKPNYKGKSIYTIDGFDQYQRDIQEINNFFIKVIYGVNSGK